MRYLVRGHALRLGGSGSHLYVELAVASPDLLSVVCSKVLSGMGTATLLVKVSSPHLKPCLGPPEVPTWEVD